MQHAESHEADAQVNLSSVYPYSVSVVMLPHSCREMNYLLIAGI